MKTRHLLFSTLSFLLLSSALKAQVDMVWDNHGIGFKVPRGFVVKTNNDSEFTATNNEVWVTILPFQDEKVTEDDLADGLVEMATGLDYDLVTDADELELDDFVGFYVRGVKDGVSAILIGLLDTESSTNLFVVIAHTEDWEDEALLIANSFYAYD